VQDLAHRVLHELRTHGYASRRDKTLTAALERLSVEQVDIVILDRDTITTDFAALVKCAQTASPRIGLISIGGDRSNASGTWNAVLPNPFLGNDLQSAIHEADATRDLELR